MVTLSPLLKSQLYIPDKLDKQEPTLVFILMMVILVLILVLFLCLCSKCNCSNTQHARKIDRLPEGVRLFTTDGVEIILDI